MEYGLRLRPHDTKDLFTPLGRNLVKAFGCEKLIEFTVATESEQAFDARLHDFGRRWLGPEKGQRLRMITDTRTAQPKNQ
jgi:hypothetical protein